MKKLMSLLLIAGMVLTFTSCEKDKSSSEKKPEKPAETKTVKKETKTPKVKPKKIEMKPIEYKGMEIDIDPIEYKPKKIESLKLKEVKFDFKVEDFELNMSDNIPKLELDKISKLSLEEKEAILKKKQNMLTALTAKLKEKNVDIMMVENTGEIILDSAILFEVDKAEVSKSGKEVLKKFAATYASVLCDDEYSDFIAKIIVEGHTDTDGSYEYNKKLSSSRAENVKKICLSDEIDVSAKERSVLKSKLVAEGCSYDRPIKDSAGNIDMTASRRVTFRFLINID